jgi:hypothetical protein
MMKTNPANEFEKNEVKSKEDAIKKLRKDRNKIKQESAIFARKVQANTSKNK